MEKLLFQIKQNFFGWTPEKVIQEAFNVNHQLAPNKITVILEGETDELYLRKCQEIFDEPDFSLDFKWIGRINEKGNIENTGDTALNQAKTFFTANMEQVKNKIVLLYDSDTNKPQEDIEKLLIRKMNINPENSIYKIGIENLLTITSDIVVVAYYKEKVKVDDYGAESTIRELDKKKLCNYICGLEIEKQKQILGKLNDEIIKLFQL